VESPKSVLTLKHTIKHEHAFVWFTTQQLTLLAMQTGLTGKDGYVYKETNKDG
jgi:hypothetical protein